MNKVEQGILFTRSYWDFSKNDVTEDCEFVRYAVDLETVENYCELPTDNGKINKEIVGKTQITANGEIIVLDIGFDDFTKLFLKFKKEGIINFYGKN
jgi:hypothetical protein